MANDYNAETIYNELVGSYYMPESFKNWESYRRKVTDFLISNMDNGKTVAIVGVGDSNDIDLERIYNHAGSLTLFDINVDSMKRALLKYNLKDKPNITLVQCDLFGATREDYMDLINICLDDFNRLKNQKIMWSPDVSESKYLKKVSEIFEKVNSRDVFISEETFDYTVMLGVHSQVVAFTERIWTLFLKVVKTLDFVVPNEIHKENHILMPQINDALIDITHKALFIGAESYEYGRNCPVEGAWQGLADIKKRISLGEFSNVSELKETWPLMEGVSYEMTIYNLEKRMGIDEMESTNQVKSKDAEKSNKLSFNAKYKKYSVIIPLVAVCLVMLIIIPAFLISKNGNGFIALLSLSLLAFSIFVKDNTNPYKAFAILMACTCIFAYILAYVFTKMLPGVDLDRWSNLISALGLFATFMCELMKIGKRLLTREEKVQQEDKK